MEDSELAEAVERCFISPNVCDSNLEAANVVDVIAQVSHNLKRVAHAITPLDAAPAHTSNGGRVGSLTEAVFYVGEELGRIADAINNLADAKRE